MPADADKHHVRLGKSESVSDGDFNRILDEAAGILASSGPVGDERTSSHGTVFS